MPLIYMTVCVSVQRQLLVSYHKMKPTDTVREQIGQLNNGT